MAEDRVT